MRALTQSPTANRGRRGVILSWRCRMPSRWQLGRLASIFEANSPQTRDYITRVGERDALEALKTNANAVGWYDRKTRQALPSWPLCTRR